MPSATIIENALASEPVKILTLWDPWASFMARGFKRWETRPWRTPYRGLIAIHAAKTTEHVWEAKTLLAGAGVLESMFDPDPFPMGDDDWPFGKIVAVGRLADCVPTTAAAPDRRERALGNYSEGRWAWIFSEIRRTRPFSYPGARGLLELPRETVSRLELLEAA